MRRQFIEVSDDMNWGKMELQQLEPSDMEVMSLVKAGAPLLTAIETQRRSSADPLKQVRIWDLQTGEGAVFTPARGEDPKAQLDQHRVWVCPLFLPFVRWLFRQDCTDITALPRLVEFPEGDVCHLQGYRRGGPDITAFGVVRDKVVEALRLAVTLPGTAVQAAAFVQASLSPEEYLIWCSHRDSLAAHEQPRLIGSMLTESGRFVAAPVVTPEGRTQIALVAKV